MEIGCKYTSKNTTIGKKNAESKSKGKGYKDKMTKTKTIIGKRNKLH